MNEISIVYATMTKHSKKIAEAVGAALQVKAQNIKESPVLGETGLLFIVTGIYGGENMPELLEFVKKLDGTKVNNVALITSSVSIKGKQQGSIRKLLEEKEIKLLGNYHCFGNFTVVKLGHPNKTEISRAVDFAKALAKGV
ncbi:MAG: flavodoxin domain-containing protein [Oscillospiraceae bacterium]